MGRIIIIEPPAGLVIDSRQAPLEALNKVHYKHYEPCLLPLDFARETGCVSFKNSEERKKNKNKNKK